jgi:prepilin-type N-terminal cleavage/methylation domain-containing protein
MPIRFNNQKGFSLLEVILAMAILAILLVGFGASLTGASKMLVLTDNSETARDLAIAQMERIKSETYDLSSYNADPDLFTASSGYSAIITVDSLKPDGRLQKVTVSIFQGTESIPAYVLTDYRTW